MCEERGKDKNLGQFGGKADQCICKKRGRRENNFEKCKFIQRGQNIVIAVGAKFDHI